MQAQIQPAMRKQALFETDTSMTLERRRMMTTLADKLMWQDGVERMGALGRGVFCSGARLEAVYSRYVGHVYTLCRRLLADTREAETATVEVFVRFIQGLPCWWNESRNLAQLRELSIEVALAQLRGRDGSKDVSGSAASPVLHTRDLTDRSLATLDLATLNDLIDRLPMTQRVAFVLHDIEELDDAAIATHLHIDETEVRRLTDNARLELLRLWRNGQL